MNYIKISTKNGVWEGCNALWERLCGLKKFVDIFWLGIGDWEFGIGNLGFGKGGEGSGGLVVVLVGRDSIAIGWAQGYRVGD